MEEVKKLWDQWRKMQVIAASPIAFTEKRRAIAEAAKEYAALLGEEARRRALVVVGITEKPVTWEEIPDEILRNDRFYEFFVKLLSLKA